MDVLTVEHCNRTDFAPRHRLFRFTQTPQALKPKLGHSTRQWISIHPWGISSLQSFISVILSYILSFQANISTMCEKSRSYYSAWLRITLKIQFLTNFIENPGIFIKYRCLEIILHATDATHRFPARSNITELRSFLANAMYSSGSNRVSNGFQRPSTETLKGLPSHLQHIIR